MYSLLLAVIYLIFISLGLPDSLLGSGWPTMRVAFGVPSSYAGYVAMAISFMTIISALISPRIIRRFHTKWIVIVSIMLTVVGLLGFSFSTSYGMLYLFAVPYGLGAGSIDASVNHYVANNYSGSVMNFLHCFYGVGAVISPNIMALALSKAKWNEGYRWTAYIQLGILLICILSLPLWKENEGSVEAEEEEQAGIREVLKVPGVALTLIAFFAYCSGEATCFLWTSSYFAGTKEGLSAGTIASFGSLIFGGLMFGRVISGFTSNKLGDRLLIRVGNAVEPSGCDRICGNRNRYGTGVSGCPAYGTGKLRKAEQCGCHRPSDGLGLRRKYIYANGFWNPSGAYRNLYHAVLSSDIYSCEHGSAGENVYCFEERRTSIKILEDDSTGISFDVSFFQ